VAKHIAHERGRPWSGTPEDLVELASEGRKILRSAAGDDGDGHRCRVQVQFRGQRESNYDSPEEFLADFRPSEISALTFVLLSFHSDVDLWAGVQLRRGLWIRPFLTAGSEDPSLADGVVQQLSGVFSGRSRFGWQGLRRPGQVTLVRGLRTRAGALVALTVTAAITAVVTIYLTKVLS
jgi:hypothetical protein